MTNSLELILHPVRIRILVAMGGREATAQQLTKLIPDVAQATLYRHLNTLLKGNLLKVVAETPIRGTIEKVYALATSDLLTLTQADIKSATAEDHARYFSIYLTTLMAEFSRYLNQSAALDLQEDGVGYHILNLHMNRDELDEFGQGLNALMTPYLEPKDDREQRLFSFTLMPGSKKEK